MSSVQQNSQAYKKTRTYGPLRKKKIDVNHPLERPNGRYTRQRLKRIVFKMLKELKKDVDKCINTRKEE